MIKIEIDKSDLQKLEADLNTLAPKIGEAVHEFTGSVVSAWKQSIIDNRSIDTGMMLNAVEAHGGYQDPAKFVVDIDTRRDKRGAAGYLEEGTEKIKPRGIVRDATGRLENQKTLETKIDQKIHETLKGNKK